MHAMEEDIAYIGDRVLEATQARPCMHRQWGKESPLLEVGVSSWMQPTQPKEQAIRSRHFKLVLGPVHSHRLGRQSEERDGDGNGQ
jgi:hypothetical protein